LDKLQGLLDQPLHLTSISAKKVYNATKGNDVWAFVLLDHVPPAPFTAIEHNTTTSEVQKLLQSYSDVFNDPQILPP
jgi:hypothetical protein